MYKKIIILLIFCSSFELLAKNISKEWLKKQPRSYAKDFYIWRFLDQNISSDDAIWALGEAKHINNKLLFRYSNKLKHKESSKVIQCIKSSPNKLVLEDADCIEVGLSTFKATKLSKDELSKVIKKVKTKYPKSAKRFEIINSPTPFIALLNSEIDVFYDTFNQCGGKFRVKYFNHHLPLEYIKKLKKDKKQFVQTIKLIVTNPKLNKIQQSLLNIDSKDLSHKGQFLLAMNAIQHNKIKQALIFLEDAYKSAYFQFDKDKVLFWKYKLTNNKNYLKKLVNSWDVNIYSLFAQEKLNIKTNNVVFNIAQKEEESNFDISTPFPWLKVLSDTKKMTPDKMKKYEKLFNKKELLGHLAFVKERFFRYKKSYFVNPYEDYIKNYPKKRQALINAIARQESRFIPTSISTAYALGVMQIMPFLSKAIAKELKETYDIDKQLEAKTNIRYANHHLNFLESRLKHPLFIAYGYNGGIGFINRVLKSGRFKKGVYEPYLSMELIPYDESKRYAKKVLLNYVIYYNNIHSKKIKLTTLLQKVKSPYHK